MELNFLSKLVCCHQYRSIRLRDPLLFIRTEGGGGVGGIGEGSKKFWGAVGGDLGGSEEF